MPESLMRLIKRSAEFQPKGEVRQIPRYLRGLYVLYKKHRKSGKEKYDVVYIGMTTAGIKGRLQSHEKSKGDLWSHFSIFEVWDNIRDDEIVELEGLFRHFYQKDTRANKLNMQKSFSKLNKMRVDDLSKWRVETK